MMLNSRFWEHGDSVVPPFFMTVCSWARCLQDWHLITKYRGGLKVKASQDQQQRQRHKKNNSITRHHVISSSVISTPSSGKPKPHENGKVLFSKEAYAKGFFCSQALELRITRIHLLQWPGPKAAVLGWASGWMSSVFTKFGLSLSFLLYFLVA